MKIAGEKRCAIQHTTLEWSRPKTSKYSMARPKRITKDKLMDAAEKLFARRGFHGTSLREITGAAGVDLALVNYHFGSKKALLAAVLSAVT